MNMKKIMIVIFGLSISFFAIGSQPQIIGFDDSEQLNVTLSRLNFNRIFVEGEKITKLTYPEGTFTIDKSNNENEISRDDSIYIKPNFHIPVTLFLTTSKGNHLSLTIKSDESLGKTVRFKVKKLTTLTYTSPQSSEDSDINTIMQSMKLGELPSGFHPVSIRPSPFYVKKNIRVLLQKEMKSDSLLGYVYTLKNVSNHPINLSTAWFIHPKAELLSLSQETILPNQTIFLYGLYRR
jgi:conjugal transfer pilus assembly protein TraK